MVVAAIPEAQATAPTPFSSAARFASAALRVGFPVREYSKAPGLPGERWANVVEETNGTTTAPDSGSGA